MTDRQTGHVWSVLQSNVLQRRYELTFILWSQFDQRRRANAILDTVSDGRQHVSTCKIRVLIKREGKEGNAFVYMILSMK